MGDQLTDALFDVTAPSSHTIDTTPAFQQFDVGDSITLKVSLDLPKIAMDNKSDLVFELFGMDPTNGVNGFHICQAHVLDANTWQGEPAVSFPETQGTNIKAIQEHPVYESHYYPNNPGIV